jgi:hypothetical protein
MNFFKMGSRKTYDTKFKEACNFHKYRMQVMHVPFSCSFHPLTHFLPAYFPDKPDDQMKVLGLILIKL